MNDQLSFSGSNPTLYNEENVGYFSSRGPTAEGLLKPDILAPGFYITSAKGSNVSTSQFCAYHKMAGTSMATPVTAGMVVKIRQYFRQGYYPSGSATVSDSFIPSGALLKAMVIHSGKKMKNAVSGSGVVTALAYPSVDQGYGRVFLNSTLRFATLSPGNQDLFVIGAARGSGVLPPKYFQSFATSGITHSYVISTSSTTKPLRVTLCYTDYPGSTLSKDVMINYLSVSISDGTTVYRPYKVSGTITSNVQMIDIPTTFPNRNYTIYVQSSWIVNGPQPYALVVTGDFATPSSTPKITTFAATKPPTRSGSGDDDNDESNKSSTTLNSTETGIVIGVVVGGVVMLIVVGIALVLFCNAQGSNTQSAVNPSAARAVPASAQYASAPPPPMVQVSQGYYAVPQVSAPQQIQYHGAGQAYAAPPSHPPPSSSGYEIELHQRNEHF